MINPMGILNRIKSLFVSAKDKADPLFDQTKESVKHIKEKLEEQAEEIGNTVSENISSGLDSAQNVTEKIAEKGSALGNKAKDFAEKVGEDVIETADKLYDRGKEKAGDLFEKGKEKAGDIKEKLSEKYDDLYEKAKDLEREEAAKPEYDPVSHAQKLKETELLKDTDSFFDKADKFADGDYKAAREGKIDIQASDEIVEETKSNEKIAGFTDDDGDGDALIDDAQIQESE